MTIKERKKQTIEKALYDYLNYTERVEDVVTSLIDGECTKHDIIYTFWNRKLYI